MKPFRVVLSDSISLNGGRSGIIKPGDVIAMIDGVPLAGETVAKLGARRLAGARCWAGARRRAGASGLSGPVRWAGAMQWAVARRLAVDGWQLMYEVGGG